MDRVDPLPGPAEGTSGPSDRGQPVRPVVPHHPSHRMLLPGSTRSTRTRGIARTPSTLRSLLSGRGRPRGSTGRSPGGTARPDALIIPTRREPGFALQGCLRLASALGCPAVFLCTGRADPAVILRMSDGLNRPPEIFLVDLSGVGGIVRTMPLAVDQHPEVLRGAHRTVAAKRNLALSLAHILGWSVLLFHDDDVHGLNVVRVRRAARRLATRSTGTVALAWRMVPVSPRSLHDPWNVEGAQGDTRSASALTCLDNSVICHARRRLDLWQDTFLGAGALLVDVGRYRCLFPGIYNDDWLYLLRAVASRELAVGGHAHQEPYDPFADPRRAEAEEFGDLLGEGLFRLLHLGVRRPLEVTDPGYWQEVLLGRRQLHEDLLRRWEDRGGNDRIRDCLVAGLTRCGQITPGSVTAFLRLWRQDLRSWREWSQQLPRLGSVGRALDILGLPASSVQCSADIPPGRR
jgi:hypothetical protein